MVKGGGEGPAGPPVGYKARAYFQISYGMTGRGGPPAGLGDKSHLVTGAQDQERRSLALALV